MSDRTGKRILVVEDDEVLLDLMKSFLEHEGYEVATAGNGHDAMERVKEGLPDLILLDMKMPVMNGWEFAARFYHGHERPAPVLVITAAAAAPSRAEDVAAAGWLGKPFSREELVAAVRARLP
jgi:urea transport system substrate-binding protein